MTIAVDAMGGDHAPDEVVKGAVAASAQGLNVILVGNEPYIRRCLEGVKTDVCVVHAPDTIGMDEPVSKALLYKTSASLRVAMELVAHGSADAVISCGNSAAIMVIALHVLGRQPGIHRPAFGGSLPTRDGSVFIVDVGANHSVDATNLVQFAIMGDVFLKVGAGIAAPRIALLSNGTEPSKGTDEIKESYELLTKLDLNFVGNIEGNQIFEGLTDVVVCDGFAGNVLLKTAEGVAVEIFDLLRREIDKDLVAKVASAALMPTFRRIKRQIDFQEYGGAPVLGVNGVVVNCHGRSKAKAVTNAILIAERMAREELVNRIEDKLNHEDVETGRRRRIARALHLRSSNP
jgi:glycerol-3-phosphate acyltransferase PlsX